MGRRKSLPLKIDSWDSRFFKKPIARLKMSGRKRYPRFTGALRDLIIRAKAQKISYLVIRLDNPELSLARKITRAGFKKEGEGVNLILRCKQRSGKISSKAKEVRLCKRKELKDACRIARVAFRLSYIYRCGFGKISDVDRYHSLWVKNLWRDKSSRVFVAKEGKKVQGFLAMSLDAREKTARIVLIAVDRKSRGRSVGQALVEKSVQWAESRAHTVLVRTQKDNKAAVVLYKKAGFKTHYYDLTFCRKFK